MLSIALQDIPGNVAVNNRILWMFRSELRSLTHVEDSWCEGLHRSSSHSGKCHGSIFTSAPYTLSLRSFLYHTILFKSWASRIPARVIFYPLSPKHYSNIYVYLTDGAARILTTTPLFYHSRNKSLVSRVTPSHGRERECTREGTREDKSANYIFRIEKNLRSCLKSNSGCLSDLCVLHPLRCAPLADQRT